MSDRIVAVLAVCAVAMVAWLAVSGMDRMYEAEVNASRWRWENVTRPAMETCRQRGGIAHLDGWGKVWCDR